MRPAGAQCNFRLDRNCARVSYLDMAEIITIESESGEREISDDEAARMGRALLGERTSLYRRRGQCVVAAFATMDDAALSPPERKEVVLGSGAGWSEAFANAHRALRNGRLSDA